MDPITLTFFYEDDTQEVVTVPFGAKTMPELKAEGSGKPTRYYADSPITQDLFRHIGNKVMVDGYVMNRAGLRDRARA